jgi:hypothetical protein
MRGFRKYVIPAAAINAATAGATILVPPITTQEPLTKYDTPVLGSALSARSGTHRVEIVNKAEGESVTRAEKEEAC